MDLFSSRVLTILVLGLVIPFSSCSGIDEQNDLYRKHISICVLGNSYSNDAFCYVPFLLKEYGISSEIHIYYRGGGSLSSLFDEWRDSRAIHYYIDTRVDTGWKKGEDITAEALLSLEKWDIVSLQQYSKQVCLIDSYYPFLPEIIQRIRDGCPNETKLAWFMAYNRPENDDKASNLKVQNSIVENHPFDLVLPVSTAVFDCQGNTILAEIGDSPYHQLFSIDSIHLQEGLPCYIAALAVTQAILDEYIPDCSVIGNQLRPTQKWIESINGITPNGESIGVSEENCLLAQKAAILANRFSFEIISIE